MLRRAALQEHEARAHGDGDERALRAVAGVEEEDHGAAAVASRGGRRPDDETRFWARAAVWLSSVSLALRALSAVRRLAALAALTLLCGF